MTISWKSEKQKTKRKKYERGRKYIEKDR